MGETVDDSLKLIQCEFCKRSFGTSSIKKHSSHCGKKYKESLKNMRNNPSGVDTKKMRQTFVILEKRFNYFEPAKTNVEPEKPIEPRQLSNSEEISNDWDYDGINVLPFLERMPDQEEPIGGKEGIHYLEMESKEQGLIQARYFIPRLSSVEEGDSVRTKPPTNRHGSLVQKRSAGSLTRHRIQGL